MSMSGGEVAHGPADRTQRPPARSRPRQGVEQPADAGVLRFAERVLSADPEREVQILDVSCGAGGVEVLTTTWGETVRSISVRTSSVKTCRSSCLPRKTPWPVWP
jgi:hypothetical protein